MNCWVINEKATRMNNDIIIQKHFNIQAVIKWKKIKSFLDNILYPLTNCLSIFLKKIQMYIYSSFYFLISFICLPISNVYSMINHCAYIQTNKAFSCTHTFTTGQTIRSFPVLSHANIEFRRRRRKKKLNFFLLSVFILTQTNNEKISLFSRQVGAINMKSRCTQ